MSHVSAVLQREQTLLFGLLTIVVTAKGVESTKSSPPCTQSLRGVATKSTDVRPDHGHLEKRSKVEHALDGVTVLGPR